MENKNHNQSTILFEGRDIFGPWKCTLSIPDGWTVIRGNWEPVKIENIGVPVGHFRAVIRDGGGR